MFSHITLMGTNLEKIFFLTIFNLILLLLNFEHFSGKYCGSYLSNKSYFQIIIRPYQEDLFECFIYTYLFTPIYFNCV